ncbi:TMV resistance protein N-like [Punica granatum]|uniref:TMV resistance protein N-like n=1 Tax=Punica granatum TaxID=22663 RepID=A0A6P8CSM9_PUNGR|nr:TMV resistance protein N-like [Punica granatum]XP_031386817.1 TMV resistance protein N-like [Punica granatum]XP_031386818.1 TMV resistance protein N-like [Punica granatum]XP_031386819.1 TMV resistance protein N-like [Punica granatum]XP_031386821.1 TMV resistance protein N-like [Punica granatum]XP_031386822.1 TMV resistance protein N-like [Punica granatum]XP_031386823.1 TMV resistance protein N-like [Punica granatum]XP_031386824.1 TMV resistance protein N-like [Punica granatum]XP_03138682
MKRRERERSAFSPELCRSAKPRAEPPPEQNAPVLDDVIPSEKEQPAVDCRLRYDVVLNTFIDESGLEGGDWIAPSLLEAIERSMITNVVLLSMRAGSAYAGKPPPEQSAPVLDDNVSSEEEQPAAESTSRRGAFDRIPFPRCMRHPKPPPEQRREREELAYLMSLALMKDGMSMSKMRAEPPPEQSAPVLDDDVAPSEKEQPAAAFDHIASETPPPTRTDRRFDVFLSFRGEDTRSSFTNHLNDALHRAGVRNTFIDESGLEGGDEIAPSLLEAIERSMITIVVLSPNYASSSWCLDELIKILECRESLGQTVLPVFYKVDPSDVRRQSGKYGEALAVHEHKSGREKVKRWTEALTKVASLSGYHLLANQRETDFIQTIVKRVMRELNRKPLHVPDNLIGMEHHNRVLYSLLDIESDDVRMLGICGMGGIGKTTITKAICNAISDRFEQNIFLAKVRECDLLQLQEKLLSQMMADVDLKLGNVDRGINLIKNSLCNRKTLIMIDDVNRLDQLETLAGGRDWFGHGSRVIITTRDEHLLVAHGVDEIYRVQPLVDHDARQLFSLTAFGTITPEAKYEQLSYKVVDYTKGLPLAIKVLGSFLRGRSLSEWRCALEKLKRVPNGEIFSVLKISFDSLDDYERAIFLDIACFFEGEHVDHVKEILQCCKLYPEIGLQVLAEKSLVTFEDNKVKMHGMIEDMGKEIVRQEAPQEPGERSRLWFHEDVLHVLTEDTGTNKIEGIKLDLVAPEEVNFSSGVFTNMKRLRLFIAHNAYHSGDSICFPRGLRWLEWPEYSSSSLPLNSGWKELVALYMPKSGINILGEEFRLFRNLRFINFNGCKLLTSIPDLSSMHSLEHLDLGECKSLQEVHQSLGHLPKVSHLNFLNCCSLREFPSSLKSKFLQSLILKGCSKLSKFPDILEEVGGVKELSLDETAIDELPPSLGNLIGLQELYLRNCKRLKNIPSSIYKLKQLERVVFCGCSELEKFPGYQEEGIDSSVISRVSAFPNLIFLDFQSCSLSEVNFLEDLHCQSTLIYLNLSGNKFTSLPAGMSKFTKLQQLSLTSCKDLQEIIELPKNITHLFAEGCESLCIFPSLSSILEFHPDVSP